jgi:putative ABC transport system permease protein
MGDGTYRSVAGNFVAENFLETAGLTMKEGRWINDRPGPMEAVINEAMAKERFSGQDPVGLYFQLQATGDLKFPIIGVVKDVRDNVRAPSGMRAYIGAWAYPLNVDTLVLRLDKDPGKDFADLVRRAVYEVDPNLVAPDVKSLTQQVIDTMATEHYAFNILRGMAAIALSLTIVGIFSVIAFTVDSRMTEFGVRLALGATPAELNGLVLRRGMTAAVVGIVVGIAGSLALTRFMASMLYETSSLDVEVYGAVAGLLVVAAAAACWLPARRAAQVDVIRLLRSD